jgi:HSP20 family molecular chaperone IbpA
MASTKHSFDQLLDDFAASPLEAIIRLASQQAANAVNKTAQSTNKPPSVNKSTNNANASMSSNVSMSTSGHRDIKMAYDRYTSEDFYYFVVECAGVSKNMLNISLVSEANVAFINIEYDRDIGCLNLSGVNKIYGEINWGVAKRAIQVPKDVDLNSIEAHLDDGLLTLVLKRLKGGGDSIFRTIPVS